MLFSLGDNVKRKGISRQNTTLYSYPLKSSSLILTSSSVKPMKSRLGSFPWCSSEVADICWAPSPQCCPLWTSNKGLLGRLLSAYRTWSWRWWPGRRQSPTSYWSTTKLQSYRFYISCNVTLLPKRCPSKNKFSDHHNCEVLEHYGIIQLLRPCCIRWVNPQHDEVKERVKDGGSFTDRNAYERACAEHITAHDLL